MCCGLAVDGRDGLEKDMAGLISNGSSDHSLERRPLQGQGSHLVGGGRVYFDLERVRISTASVCGDVAGY